MAGARSNHTLSLLESVGKVLVTGGTANSPLSTAELYEYASCVSQPSGSVHWWRAEDNAVDALGAKNGTAVGGLAYATGRVGRAFQLDGVDDHIALPRISLGAFAGLTYDAWIQTTSTDASSTYAGNAALNILGDSATSVWIGFGVHGGKVRYTRAVSSSTWANVTGRISVNDGAWHHIAATHDPATGNIVLYVDGVVDVTGQIAWERVNAAVNLLGAGYGPQDRFVGRLDEVSIYNRVLGPTEIAALHAAGAGKCVNATCSDGLRNGSEPDVDCGGGSCGVCAQGRTCAAAIDCVSGVCSGGTCGGYTSSCKAIQAGSPSAPSGLYTVDADGTGPLGPFKVFCDMTTAGGGWTVIEKSPYGNAIGRAFYSEAPANEGSPELSRHRLSKARMTALQSISSDMRVDCRGNDYLVTAASNLFRGQGGPNSCNNAAAILYKAASLKGRLLTNRTLCTWFPGTSEGCHAWHVDEWAQSAYCGLPDYPWTGSAGAITSYSADSFSTEPYYADTTGHECHTAGAVRHTLLR
jgi:hypothetical protein